MKTDTVAISPTVWLPMLAILVCVAVFAGIELASAGDNNPRTVADDCFSDLVVKQQTGQIGRYGIVDGLGENAPLTHGILKSICEDAWSIEGPSRSPLPFACPEKLRLQVPGGTPYPDPDCATPTPIGETASPTIDTSPAAQTPTQTPAGLPDTGGAP